MSSRLRVIDVDEISFPAMTVCNMNQIKKSYAEQDNFMKNVLLALNPTALSNVSLFDPAVMHKIETEYDMIQIFRDGSFTLQEMFVGCYWQQMWTKCSNLFTKIKTSMGYCFTFNSAEFIERNGKAMSSQSGVKAGLAIEVNVNQEEYFFQSGDSAGIRVSGQVVKIR